MSYIRMGHPLRFVDGNSEDYVFLSEDGKGNNYIEDYRGISDSGFIELLYTYWEDKSGLKEHLLKRLAERLNVGLRKNPLSENEYVKLILKEHKK